MHKISAAVVLALTVSAGAAFAQPVDYKAAKKLLFSTKGGSFQIVGQENLSETDIAILQQMPKVDKYNTLKYYAAIAIEPDKGLLGGPISAVNFHTSVAAQRAALGECNARRDGGRDCVIVAIIGPKKWKAAPLTMSLAATASFRKDYRALKAPKAMAVSAATGEWAFASGPNAQARAIADCNAKITGKTGADCYAAVIDN